MNRAYIESMGATVERLEAEKDDIKGVVITSAKKTFFAGGDLNDLMKVTREHAAEFAAGVREVKASCAGWRRSAARSSPRSTAPRWAAAWRSRWPPTTASSSTTRRPSSASPRSSWGCCPAAAASCAPCACSASSTR